MRKYKVVEYGAFQYAIMYKSKWYQFWNFYGVNPNPFTKGIQKFDSLKEANQFIQDGVKIDEPSQS